MLFFFFTHKNLQSFIWTVSRGPDGLLNTSFCFAHLSLGCLSLGTHSGSGVPACCSSQPVVNPQPGSVRSFFLHAFLLTALPLALLHGVTQASPCPLLQLSPLPGPFRRGWDMGSRQNLLELGLPHLSTVFLHYYSSVQQPWWVCPSLLLDQDPALIDVI